MEKQMRDIHVNSSIQPLIENIHSSYKHNKIINISEVKLVTPRYVEITSELGNYVKKIRMNVTQEVIVMYENEMGIRNQDIIIAGNDAIEYEYVNNDWFLGNILDSDGCVSTKFIGEYAQVVQ